jgi:hypothetical protein
MYGTAKRFLNGYLALAVCKRQETLICINQKGMIKMVEKFENSEWVKEIWNAIDKESIERSRLDAIMQKVQGQLTCDENRITMLEKRLEHHLSTFDEGHHEGRRRA